MPSKYEEIFGSIATGRTDFQLVIEQVDENRLRVRCQNNGFGTEIEVSPDTAGLVEFAKSEHDKTMKANEVAANARMKKRTEKANKPAEEKRARMVPSEPANQNSAETKSGTA